MLEDISITALQAAMRGLSARQQAISDNIANANTPYFTARSVSFESGLKQALSDGDNPLSVTPQVGYTTDAANLNGNNVDLNFQTVQSVETQMKYDLALRATGDRFTLLRTAARGS